MHKPLATISQALLITTIFLLVVCLPLSNSSVSINGIQTAKSFNFFYSMLALLAVAATGLLFTKGKLKLNITLIDVLLVAFVVWLTVNKYFLQGVHSFSLRYFELLGLVALYTIVRTLKTEYTLYLLLAICVSGAVQAVYGNLQLWGHYPSHHGLFKMTGSFFNPGPYAGYLCAVLPVAVGLFWMHESFRLQVSDSKFQVSGFRLSGFRLAQLGTWNLKPGIIKYLSLTTIITILLVLPAARSRAAWLGAIAGVAYLAWHKYNIGELFKHTIKVRNSVLATTLAIVMLAASLGLYHFKKDSADGRMLIWTVTANIIKDNPLVGVGHDRFKAHYMDYQADYFRNNPGSKYETVADDNQYAFNEPLNVWVENGLIGLLLMLAILCFVFLSNSKEIESSKIGLLKSVSFRRGTRRNLFNNGGIPPYVGMTIHSNCEALNGEAIKREASNTSEASIERERSPDINRDQTAQQSEASNSDAQTILKASLLAILVFGLFAYPSEILPTKIIATVCLAMLASTTTSLLKSDEYSFVPFVKNPLCPSWLKPLWLKSSLALATLAVMVLLLPPIKRLHGDYATWKNALDLYNYGLYEQCLADYEKAYLVLKHNGEFLINYGKALSIAEKHAEAIAILEQAKSHQSNSVLYTALGDSHKALEEYQSAEQNYLQSANMSPGKFYPLYLLAKLYDASGQQHKAIAMANTILNKEVKVHSTAIDEIKAEMKTILAK